MKIFDVAENALNTADVILNSLYDGAHVYAFEKKVEHANAFKEANDEWKKIPQEDQKAFEDWLSKCRGK